MPLNNINLVIYKNKLKYKLFIEKLTKILQSKNQKNEKLELISQKD